MSSLRHRHHQDLAQQVLRTDISGLPLEWIDYRHAAKLHCLGQVSYSIGAELYRIRGGMCAATGQRSELTINAIVATWGVNPELSGSQCQYRPPLTNQALFRRDACICLYCGKQFAPSDLSRDHVRPQVRGGKDVWVNVVTACKRCNNFKACRTPEEAGLELLAIPFEPNHAEYVYLQGKRILADQMEFLLAHFPHNSPLRQRLQ